MISPAAVTMARWAVVLAVLVLPRLHRGRSRF